MGRKRIANREALVNKHIQAKVTEKVYNRLKKMQQQSDCQSIGELARRILSKEKIICYYKDSSLDNLMERLAGIEKELNAIGVNINQITKNFHIADLPDTKASQAFRAAEEYKKVGRKVDELLGIVSQLAKKWLQK